MASSRASLAQSESDTERNLRPDGAILKALSPLDQFVRHTVESLGADTFVRLLLSQPAGSDRRVERIVGRLVVLRGRSALSLTSKEAARDTAKNLPLEEVPAWLAEQVPAHFRSAVLETTLRTWQLAPAPDGRLRLAAHRPHQPAPPPRSHDEPKAGALDASALPWLVRTGICTPDGRVRASMAGKHRQLERYLEIVGHLVRDGGWKPGDTISVADMGCGKGYLTFGLWHLLEKRLGLRAQVLGVDARPDLAENAEAVARAVGADGLHFVTGTIAGAPLPPLDALVALHACDTATDDALRRGIRLGARLVVVSPCCHRELRPRLGRPEPLAPLLAHGILAERFAEWLTDGLRALHLERAGYAAKVVEFVPSEHTPRNLLVAGVRRDPPDPAARARAGAAIQSLTAFAGLGAHALGGLLLEPLPAAPEPGGVSAAGPGC
jgi:SAM-dependent methyltransferase